MHLTCCVVRHVPDWVPGTNWKRTAKQWRSEFDDVVEKPYAFVKDQKAQGKNEPSFLSQLLDQDTTDQGELAIDKMAAMSLYTGGADTVSFLAPLPSIQLETDEVL